VLTTLADRGEADREVGLPVRYWANAATAAIAPRAPAPAAPKPAVSPVPPLADGHRWCRQAAPVHPGAGQGLAVYGSLPEPPPTVCFLTGMKYGSGMNARPGNPIS